MSRSQRVLRAVASLLVVGFLAALLSIGLRMMLELAGLPVGLAGPIGIVVAITVALAVADVYTPIGRGPRHGDIREKAPEAVAADLLLAALLALATSAALVFLGATVWSPLGSLLVVFIVGTGVGYGAFMLRNREYYFRERPETVGNVEE